MDKRYILDGQNVVEEPDLMKWALWFEKGNRVVKKDYTENGRISTVFLGLDYSFDDGPPLLFETMVFGGSLDQEQKRYATWDEAVAGHEAIKQRVEKGKHE